MLTLVGQRHHGATADKEERRKLRSIGVTPRRKMATIYRHLRRGGGGEVPFLYPPPRRNLATISRHLRRGDVEDFRSCTHPACQYWSLQRSPACPPCNLNARMPIGGAAPRPTSRNAPTQPRSRRPRKRRPRRWRSA